MIQRLATARKAWSSGLVAGAIAVASAASQMDFNTLTMNNYRDLVIAFVIAALTTGGSTYIIRNKQ
jgi:hypothetical protein